MRVDFRTTLEAEGSRVVTPRDVHDAEATVAAEGRGSTPQKVPATELPEHYKEMLESLRTLGTAAPDTCKWGRDPEGSIRPGGPECSSTVRKVIRSLRCSS